MGWGRPHPPSHGGVRFRHPSRWGTTPGTPWAANGAGVPLVRPMGTGGEPGARPRGTRGHVVGRWVVVGVRPGWAALEAQLIWRG